MAITQADIDAVVEEIRTLEAASFSDGELAVNQRDTIATLRDKLAFMRAEMARSSGLTFGDCKIKGID